MLKIIFFIIYRSFLGLHKFIIITIMSAIKKSDTEDQFPPLKMEAPQYHKAQMGALELLDKAPTADNDYRMMMVDKYFKSLNLQLVDTKLNTGIKIFKENLPEDQKTAIYGFAREKFDHLDADTKLKALVPSTYCGVNLHSDEEFTKIVDNFFTKYFRSKSVVDGFVDYVFHHVFTDKMRNEFIITSDKMSNADKNLKLIEIFQDKYEKNPKTLQKYFSSENFDKFWTIVYENDKLDSEFEKFKKLHEELQKKLTDEHISHFLGLEKSSETDASIKMEDRNGVLGAIYKKAHKTKAPPKKKEVEKKTMLSKSEKAKLKAQKHVAATQSVTSDSHSSEENHVMPSDAQKCLQDKDAANSEADTSELVAKAQRMVDKYQKKVDEAEDDSDDKTKAEKQLTKAKKELAQAKKKHSESDDDE